MNAELIAVGTEILLGDIVNTDAQLISQGLSELGINVFYQTVVGDNPARLRHVIETARDRADIIITTMRTTAVDTNTASIMNTNTAAADTTITTMARTTAAMMTMMTNTVDMSTASITKVTRNTTTLPLRNLSASST